MAKAVDSIQSHSTSNPCSFAQKGRARRAQRRSAADRRHARRIRYASQLHVRSHLENSEHHRGQTAGRILRAGEHQPARAYIPKFCRSRLIKQGGRCSRARARGASGTIAPCGSSYATSIDIIKRRPPIASRISCRTLVAGHPELKTRQSGPDRGIPRCNLPRQRPGFLGFSLRATLGMTRWRASTFDHLVLVAALFHLPFVCCRPEHEPFHEENWLFRGDAARATCHGAAAVMMQRLLRRGIRFQITLSVSPALCAMLRRSAPRAIALSPASRSPWWLSERECGGSKGADERFACPGFLYRDFLRGARRTFALKNGIAICWGFSAASWNRRRRNNG